MMMYVLLLLKHGRPRPGPKPGGGRMSPGTASFTSSASLLVPWPRQPRPRLRRSCGR